MGKQLGSERSGFSIVNVDDETITHHYHDFDSLAYEIAGYKWRVDNTSFRLHSKLLGCRFLYSEGEQQQYWDVASLASMMKSTTSTVHCSAKKKSVLLNLLPWAQSLHGCSKVAGSLLRQAPLQIADVETKRMKTTDTFSCCILGTTRLILFVRLVSLLVVCLRHFCWFLLALTWCLTED